MAVAVTVSVVIVIVVIVVVDAAAAIVLGEDRVSGGLIHELAGALCIGSEVLKNGGNFIHDSATGNSEGLSFLKGSDNIGRRVVLRCYRA